jgi:hypothetical protein
VTIAACYLSPEGVVLGSDSTSTYSLPSPFPFLPSKERHYNFGQKIFEVGKNSNLAIVTWGLGGLSVGSYRTLIARLADNLDALPAHSVLEVAERWAKQFWASYSKSLLAEITQLKILDAKKAFDPQKPVDPANRTLQEEMFFQQNKQGLVVGFCLGGCVKDDRVPHAYEIVFDPLLANEPVPEHLPQAQSFWGVPALISRLINGCADEVVNAILQSGKWSGSEADLMALISRSKLVHPSTVPIREAIDFTHACLLTTIKAMKFSNLPLVCGGPIELAVITTDREFRWVRHKSWEAAIRDGESYAI